jgi:hypothetical protein
MSRIWNSVFKELPGNGEEVWIRVLNYYGPPVKAMFSANEKEFESVVTGVKVPIYYVVRWSPL